MADFGLALGGGGVKGLAHIALLKALDNFGVKPKVISGTSIGAIIGALYAAGLSGEEIETRVKDHIFSSKESIKKAFSRRKNLVKWVRVFRYEKARGGIITADGLFEHLFTELADIDFEELKIPFTAIACDFYRAVEVPINNGKVLDAVRASMAVPGVFAPVVRGEKLLVDGGLVNNVPCDHLHSCDTIIASDVISLSTIQNPKNTQVLSGALSIMLRIASEEKYKNHPPDFLFKPNTEKIDAFDFHKIRHVLERGEQAIKETEKQLENLLKKKCIIP